MAAVCSAANLLQSVRLHRLIADQWRPLNMFITDLWNEAEALAEVMEPVTSDDHLPLHGRLLAVKDNFCVSGSKTTCGSLMLNNFVSPYTATVVNRLQDAGMIVVGKTNMDSFAMGSGSADGFTGPVKNPWSYLDRNIVDKLSNDDDFYISGGSSGGSAVAVAVGAVSGGIGSDTGGSVRVPAAYCGVVGLKPTYGLLSRHGLISLVNSLDCPGLFSSDIDTCTHMLNCSAGFDSYDSTTHHSQVYDDVPLVSSPSVKGLRVGIPQEYRTDDTSEEVISVWHTVADEMEKAGADVIPVNLPHTQHSICCYSVLNATEVASNMARYDGLQFGYRGSDESSTDSLYADSRHIALSSVVRGRMFAGNYFLLRGMYSKYQEKAAKVIRLIYNDFLSAFSNVDVLVAPVVHTDALLHSHFSSLDNRQQCVIQDAFTQPSNLAGVPALSMPITLSAQRLPLAIQLIGRWFDEKTLLHTGKWLENTFQFNPLYKRLQS